MLTVAVIGLGSRGLSVLERTLTLARRDPAGVGPVRVELIDPRADGAGAHPTDQPDYLLLNTICDGINMFPDALSVGDAVVESGPSLYRWARDRDLRLAEDGFTVGEVGREIRPTDFLPRRVLGEYLGWFFDRLKHRVPAGVELQVHRSEAVDLVDGPDRQPRITLADGTVLTADHAFLTTGHTPNRPTATGPGRHRWIDAPYPLPDQLAAVTPGESVAIGGFGLSAMDVMASLTVGRGGRFHHDRDGCRYLPSGREPVLLFYSRTGVPFRVRPLVTAYPPPYQPVVFTPAALDERRAARRGALDLDQDVRPLLLTEIRIAYRRREAALAGPAVADQRERELAAAGPAGVAALLDQWDVNHGRFDPQVALDPTGEVRRDDRDGYQKWLAEFVDSDLAEGVAGFAGSPVKAGLDVLRSLRDTIRYAVDFGGLTPASTREFFRREVSLLNRAVVGPQFERYRELRGLFATGLAAAPFGPAPAVTWDGDRDLWSIRSTTLDTPYARTADWFCPGNIQFPAVPASASPLLQALYRAGTIRPGSGEGDLRGLDVSPEQHPIGADWRPHPRLWVLGPLCEGTTYYNNALPWTGTFSRPAYDAHRCVTSLFGVPHERDHQPPRPH